MKFKAQNEIRGLELPKKGKDGAMIEHVVKTGQIVELDKEDAEPFVKGGSLVALDQPAAEPAPAPQV